MLRHMSVSYFFKRLMYVQVLRKKYWNMLEDMKGKIRVFARCRPISEKELTAGNKCVVNFPDDMTIELQSDKGLKSFVFDSCFGPSTTQVEKEGHRVRACFAIIAVAPRRFVKRMCVDPLQDAIFEDLENLVQSALDGYNVSCFAYGQTGSGKTFTMVGNRALPGVMPRSVRRLFSLIEKNRHVLDVRVQVRFL